MWIKPQKKLGDRQYINANIFGTLEVVKAVDLDLMDNSELIKLEEDEFNLYLSSYLIIGVIDEDVTVLGEYPCEQYAELAYCMIKDDMQCGNLIIIPEVEEISLICDVNGNTDTEYNCLK